MSTVYLVFTPPYHPGFILEVNAGEYHHAVQLQHIVSDCISDYIHKNIATLELSRLDGTVEHMPSEREPGVVVCRKDELNRSILQLKIRNSYVTRSFEECKYNSETLITALRNGSLSGEVACKLVDLENTEQNKEQERETRQVPALNLR